MKHLFTALYKIAEIVQALCVWLAFLCIAVWCYRFINFAYDGSGFFGIIEYVPNIVRNMMPYTVDFAGRPIDISYFPAAVILFVVHLAIKTALMEVLEACIRESQKREFLNKEKEEAELNKEIEEELKKTTLVNRCFVGLLDIHLEYTTDENLTKDRRKIADIKEDNNKYILYNLFEKQGIKGALKGGKIVIVCDNFNKFDVHLRGLVNLIKEIYPKNKANGIQTSFTLSYDALSDPTLKGPAIKVLEKISSFRYYNKIIVTTLFASRYGYFEYPAFDLRTMGISRFFEKIVEPNGEYGFKSEDFDLYSLKFRG